jgi:hypothetical protein
MSIHQIPNLQRKAPMLGKREDCSAGEKKVEVFIKHSAWELAHKSVQTTTYWGRPTIGLKQHSTGDDPQ